MKFLIILSIVSNLTWAPDSSRFAFTRDGDLYVCEKGSRDSVRLTFDGSRTVLNAYASWVYYEEIFGRSSNYRAFWWSPDSRRIAFYRFDNSKVPVFPIYSAEGQDGSLNLTRYPKVGEPNPQVKVGMIDVVSGGKTVWADFPYPDDCYYGTPFWDADSKNLYVQREPRVQNSLELFRVDASDGSKSLVYSEKYRTWLDWISGMLFDEKGLYMVRSFETGWEQIYYLSFDGRACKRLTEGANWRMRLLRLDTKGIVWFIAQRDSRVKSSLYRLNRRGRIESVVDTAYNVASASVSADGRSVKAKLSNCHTPAFDWDISRGPKPSGPAPDSGIPVPQMLSIKASDGQAMYAKIYYPRDFDAASSRRYPVHMEIYGGPNTAYVTDSWREPRDYERWFFENGIIHVVADVRVSGHTGRAGTDLAWRDLQSAAQEDFVRWAEYFGSLPYVNPSRIGVEGFSFGGTNTALLLINHSDIFRCGIAGGGVYDWKLYDSHYTERFMDTIGNNPEGYARTVISQVGNYPGDGSTMLRITHGTGDDNVHFQNSLQLIKELQMQGKRFEMMIYPDALHGYRGKQHLHCFGDEKIFWTKYLLDN